MRVGRPIGARRALLLACAAGAIVTIAALALPPCGGTPARENEFSARWHDGKAELDGYRLTVRRYGQERPGRAVMIFVTEPMSESRLVKVEGPLQDPGDVFDALKLNLVRDFQTGIYDYNTMVSVFSRTDTFQPAKVSFTSAEWCGHVYEEVSFRGQRIQDSLRSYFEGESREVELPAERGGVQEDNLFILLRGLRGDYLARGERKEVPYLPSLFWGRLSHRPLAWTTATVERLPETETARVPAGDLSAAVYVVRVAGGREGRFWIEEAEPHRVVRWSWTEAMKDGPATVEEGELTGTSRLAYWKLHDNGHESYLAALGLATTAP